MLNSTCDDSVNTNTGLKCTSIDLLQLGTLWNNVVNSTIYMHYKCFCYERYNIRKMVKALLLIFQKLDLHLPNLRRRPL